MVINSQNAISKIHALIRTNELMKILINQFKKINRSDFVYSSLLYLLTFFLLRIKN